MGATQCLPVSSPAHKGKVFVDETLQDEIHSFSLRLDGSPSLSGKVAPSTPPVTTPVLMPPFQQQHHKPRISNATATTTATHSAASTPRHSGSNMLPLSLSLSRSTSNTARPTAKCTDDAAAAEEEEEDAEEEEELPEPVEIAMLRVPLVQRHPFQDFRFGRKLGEGSFSIVFQATRTRSVRRPAEQSRTDTHTQTETETQSVAIKEVDVRALTRQQVADAYIEMNLLSQLAHPNIVKLHSVYASGDKRFLVLEHLQGGDLLSAVCKREFFSEPEARQIFSQIASALVYLHGRGVAHRDLKPENVMLVARDKDELAVKLVDFGFATVDAEREKELQSERERRRLRRHRLSSEREKKPDMAAVRMSPIGSLRKALSKESVSPAPSAPTKSGNNKSSTDKENEGGAVREREKQKSRYLCGTPGYMAPEIVRERRYSTRSDCWALGVLLYITLSGLMPFPTDKDGERFVLAGDFSFHDCRFQCVSSSAKDLVSRLLCVDTQLRLTAAETLSHRWLRLPTLAAPPNSADCSLSVPLSLAAPGSLCHSLHDAVDQRVCDAPSPANKFELSGRWDPLRAKHAQRSALEVLVDTLSGSLSSSRRVSITPQLQSRKTLSKRDRQRRASDPSLYLDPLRSPHDHTPPAHNAQAGAPREGAEQSEIDNDSSGGSDAEAVQELPQRRDANSGKARPRRHSVK